jgi:ribosomal protein S18 acetylase RimI-like enzyme
MGNPDTLENRGLSPFIQVIESALPGDFAAIAALNTAAYEEFSSSLATGAWEVMKKNLRNIAGRAERAEFLIVRDGGDIVGSVAYGPPGKGDPEIFAPNMAAILLLSVHPAHRGKGIARALTEACIARARRDKAVSVGLFTSELMQAAQHVYQSLGFVMESELPPRYGIRYFRYVLPLA